MDAKFILSSESTVDLPYSYLESRNVPVLFYKYRIDDQEYVDDMGRDPEARPLFYALLAAGHLPQTSQMNVAEYEDFLEPLLQKGDVLHLAFTSGQSGSVHNAFLAAEILRKKYPERKLVVIDSLCSSSGFGMLVDYAADLRDEGKTIDEVADWVMANRNCVHHQFFSSNMTQFKRTGRVSGAAATIATILSICPIMRLDDCGRIIAYDKVRGKKNAVQRTVETMAEHIQNGADYDGKCFVCHSECADDAQLLIDAVEARFPRLKGAIRLYDIGTIIGSHSGPGTVAVFFLGNKRQPDKG